MAAREEGFLGAVPVLLILDSVLGAGEERGVRRGGGFGSCRSVVGDELLWRTDSCSFMGLPLLLCFFNGGNSVGVATWVSNGVGWVIGAVVCLDSLDVASSSPSGEVEYI